MSEDIHTVSSFTSGRLQRPERSGRDVGAPVARVRLRVEVRVPVHCEERTLSAGDTASWGHCQVGTLSVGDTVSWGHCQLGTLSGGDTVSWGHCHVGTLSVGDTGRHC